MPKACFTRHGRLRVAGGDGEERRLRLSPEEVAEILDQDKAVPIGRDPKDAHKIHRAFYSVPDDDCFIAVQDDEDGEVITVLPFSHHGRFVVDPIQVRVMAMKLAGIETDQACEGAPGTTLPELPIVAGPDTDCVVAAEFRHPKDYQQKVKLRRLARFPVPEGSVLENIFADEEICKRIEPECIWAFSYHPRGSELVRFRAHFVSGGEVSEFRWFLKDAVFR